MKILFAQRNSKVARNFVIAHLMFRRKTTVDMVGPSLEAIKKFKEQQERKKRDELEKKVQEKLSTLEYRASKGDRKAKQDLKRIEKIKEERPKLPPPKPAEPARLEQKEASKTKRATQTDFEELMKLAKQNSNEIRRSEKPEPETKLKPKQKPIIKTKLEPVVEPRSEPKLKLKPNLIPNSGSNPSLNLKPKPMLKRKPIPSAHEAPQYQKYIKPPVRPVRMMRRYEDKDEYEDDYESDGFVVDDEYDDAREELSKTLKSVFRYDKRRCDLREEEIDRQYRAIGRVSTFEDLEREERRASRLAALEDAKALKEEDERKRMKKLRLNR